MGAPLLQQRRGGRCPVGLVEPPEGVFQDLGRYGRVVAGRSGVTADDGHLGVPVGEVLHLMGKGVGLVVGGGRRRSAAACVVEQRRCGRHHQGVLAGGGVQHGGLWRQVGEGKVGVMLRSLVPRTFLAVLGDTESKCS